jgi:hypothetical protein
VAIDFGSDNAERLVKEDFDAGIEGGCGTECLGRREGGSSQGKRRVFEELASGQGHDGLRQRF